MDVASSLPDHAEIFAIDIEARQFPQNPPGNVTFRVEDIRSLPAEWDDTFVLAHARLLGCAFGVPEWERALKSFLRVLKPGGYIRLMEPCSPISRLRDENFPAPHTARLSALIQRLLKSRGLLTDTGVRLPIMVKDAGLHDVQEIRKVSISGGGDASTAETMAGAVAFYRAMKVPLVRAGGQLSISLIVPREAH